MNWLALYYFLLIFSVVGSIGTVLYAIGKEKHSKRVQLKMALQNAQKQALEQEEEKLEQQQQEPIEKEELKQILEERKLEMELSSDKEILKMMKQAETKIGMHEYEEAEKILIQILSYQEFHREALESIGHLYLLLDKPAKAVFFLEQHLEHHVPTPAIFTNYALASLHMQEFETAIKYYGKAIDLDPSNPIRYANLGQVLLTVQHNDDAIRCFQEAIKLDPRNRDYYTVIADTLRADHHFAEAKQWYLKILGFSPYDQHAQQEVEKLTALGF